VFKFIQTAARNAVQNARRGALALLALLFMAAQARATVTEDAEDLVAAAQTTFEAVAAVVILVLGFTLVVKFVKKLRGA